MGERRSSGPNFQGRPLWALVAVVTVNLHLVLPGVEAQVYRGDRVATMATLVPRVNEGLRGVITATAVRHPSFAENVPIWPTALTELVTVYLSLPEGVFVFEEAFSQCAMLCTLYNQAGGAPACGLVQVETRACHPLTYEDRPPGDTSDGAHVWCLFVKMGAPLWRDVGVRQGARVVYDRTVAATCMGFGGLDGDMCGEATLVVPSVAQIGFWKWAFSWTSRMWCVPLLPPDVADKLWELTFSGACGMDGCGSWATLVAATGSLPQDAWLNLVCTSKQQPLLPGACYCAGAGEATGPTCEPAVPGCRGVAVKGVASVAVSTWVTLGPVVDTTEGVRDPEFELVDGSWAGFGVRKGVCAPGGCLDESKEGEGCDLQACVSRPGSMELDRCGGPGVGVCTLYLQGGCECARGGGRDPVAACAKCLPTHTPKEVQGAIVCEFLAGACFPGLGGDASPVSPTPACSGRGVCFRGGTGHFQCLCNRGWAGPLCDTPSAFTSVAPTMGTAVLCGVASVMGASCARSAWGSMSTGEGQAGVCGSRVVYLPGLALQAPEAAQAMCVALGGSVATQGEVALEDTGEGRLQHPGWVKVGDTGQLVHVGVEEGVVTMGGVFCVAPKCTMGSAWPTFRGPLARGWIARRVQTDAPGLFRSLVLVNALGRASALDAACGSGSREQWLDTREPNATLEYMWGQFLWSAQWLARTVFPQARVPDLGGVLGVTGEEQGPVFVTGVVDRVRVVWQVAQAPGVAPTLVVVDPSVYPVNRNEVGGLVVLCAVSPGKFEDLARMEPHVVVVDTVASEWATTS